MAEPTSNKRSDLLNQMEALRLQLRDTSDLVIRRMRELRAMDGNAAVAPPRSGAPYERVPISPSVMNKTATEVLLNPPKMPDLRMPDSDGDPPSPPATEGRGDASSPTDVAAWRAWANRGPQGPLEEGACDGLIELTERNRHRFATLAHAPTFDGPRDAVFGFAECCEALGDAGAAIEAYEALLDRAREDDKPPPWVQDLRAKLAALRGSGDR